MSTVSARLTVRDIDVDVVYKDIKNLHIGVYPPVGRVRVAAPTRLGDEWRGRRDELNNAPLADGRWVHAN